jgi:hypothetical protein
MIHALTDLDKPVALISDVAHPPLFFSALFDEDLIGKMYVRLS